MMRAAAALLLAAAVPRADAHGAMQYPPTWHDPGGVYAKFITDPTQLGAGSQCSAGCTGKKAGGEIEAAQGCACEWYTNNTFLPKGQQATIPNKSPLRTYMDGAQPSLCASPASEPQCRCARSPRI